MPRAPRRIEPGGIYHAAPRGNDGRAIFLGEADRSRFLVRLGLVAARYEWLVFGYCLMTNHAHLLVQVPEAGLSEGMRELLGKYACWWNSEHGHYGHLFRNRFTSSPVRSERHLISAARYVDLNPVRAGLHAHPGQWRWSSYRAHVGDEHPPPFLAQGAFLELLGPTPDRARRAYRRFVREGQVPVSDTGVKRPQQVRG